jgi:hypothetical protein
MDLSLYLRVLSRFRVLVLFGLALAITLSFFSFVRIDVQDGRPLFVYREQEEWVSTSTLLVTQRGFPWGRSVVDPAAPDGPDAPAEGDRPGVRFADPGRFSSLAVLYSHLADSDQVREIMRQDGPIRGKIEANPVLSQAGFAEALPLIEVLAYANSRGNAIALARRVTAGFRTFLDEEQDASAIPDRERVVVTVVKDARKAEIFTPRSRTIPIVVFLTVMVSVIGLAFILENLRPRVAAVRERSRASAEAASSRRSA